jgi:predicted metal-binding membrane protein
MGVVAAIGRREILRRLVTERASQRAFFGVSALLFAASTAVTILWCASMSAMGGMPMPGGWMMSMAWMRMPGQTWPRAAASFLGMWVVMMVAMMLPSLVPMLWRYRQAVGRPAASAPTSPFELPAFAKASARSRRSSLHIQPASGGGRRGLAVALRAEADKATASCADQPPLKLRRSAGALAKAEAPRRRGEARLGRLTALVGVGYFCVWTVFGMAAFPLGVALAAVEMEEPALARAVPIAVGVVVLMAGSLQLTAWKARHLACCREAPGRGHTLSADVGTAWRHGLRLGLHCSLCCAGLMAILLVIGVMDLRAMVVVAAAITVERLAPAGERVARAIGAVVVGAGLFLIARAAGLG